MDWIKGRLKEPSSYGAAAVVGVGLGILLTLPILTWAGIVCAIFGLVLKEKSSEQAMSLYENIRKKKARIKGGSGETMRKKGDKGAPAKGIFSKIAKAEKKKKKKKKTKKRKT